MGRPPKPPRRTSRTASIAVITGYRGLALACPPSAPNAVAKRSRVNQQGRSRTLPCHERQTAMQALASRMAREWRSHSRGRDMGTERSPTQIETRI